MLDGLVICKLKTFIVGLEEEGYTLGKGRQPLLTFQQRMSLWSMIAPNQSVIFPIPPRPEQISADIYYDWISKTVGVYKNPRVVFVGSQDDPQQIKDAHFRRAFSSQHVLQTSIGIPPVHTTELLKS
ncbi:hypothetical protein HY310_00310 [Candidatus Microgenomates bacterium]|nr:hypothetical protein [Candidatus Microgenomates bacterium]